MSSRGRQANFLLPDDLVEELKESVPKRQQSRFVVEALRKELKQLKLKKTIEGSFGAWKVEEHPELDKGAEHFIRKLRKSTRTNRIK